MRRIARLVVVLFVAAVIAGPTASAGEAEFTFRENDVGLGDISRTIHVSPGGGDDTQRLQGALDAASGAGPGAVIELSAGTFHVGRPLIGTNLDVTIRGAGMGETTVLADGRFNPDGLFQGIPPDEAAALRSLDYPFLFLFHEGDVDRFGTPVEGRSQRVVMTDLTLGASGRTVAHFDINEFTDTQRLFSLVWFQGDHPDWTNSQNQTPADSGAIDQEHAQVSTVRASFREVHFDGRNRARADGEPGGAFDPNPDVRNAFGVEGGLVVVSELPDLVFFFKPINAALVFADSRFTDLPGQAGIFAPQLVGPGDPAWTFGPDAVNASVTVRRSIFEDTYAGVLAGDLSDVDITVDSSAFRREVFGVVLWTNYQSTDGDAIGYPASVPSQVRINDSTFSDVDAASILMDEYVGPSLVDLKISESDFAMMSSSQVGILGNRVEAARIVGNDFSGEGYGAIVAVTSARWRIRKNGFCDLVIPQSATAHPDLFLPPNETQSPIVLVDSVDIGTADNTCASSLNSR